MNLVLVLFFCFLFLMLILGIPSNMDLKWVPKIVTDVLLYGKNTEGRFLDSLVQSILIPKSWFSHFYAFATLYMLFVLSILISKFVWNIQPPKVLTSYIGFVAPYHHHALVTPGISLLAATLFLFHVSRRLYETVNVNVFSSAKMNIIHYLTGILHYWGCCTVLLAYAENFSKPDLQLLYPVQIEIHLQQVFGTIAFLFASYQQYVAHSTLANLRKATKNKEQYVLPHGGLFNYVSCPNFLCEVIIYFSVYIILGFGHYPWALITSWVFVNQILAAMMAQNWYKTKFKTFPVTRKAIIPFVI